MIDCPHLVKDICQIATKLAGQTCPVMEVQCLTCISTPAPRAENNMTAGLAILSWKGNKNKIKELLVTLKDIIPIGMPVQKGPGTELKSILAHLKIFPTGQCGCEETAQLMNKMGSRECRKDVSMLVERIGKSAKELGWRWTYSPTAVRGMILIACDLADGLTWVSALLRLPRELIK